MPNKILGMATLAKVDDFKIGMFPRLGKHQAPYFKAYKGDGKTQSASILIDSLEIVFIKGLTTKELSIVIDWAKLNKNDLQKNWKNMTEGKSFFKIKSSAPPSIKSVQALKELILEIHFEDGSVKQVDFKKMDLFGILKPLRQQDFFKEVQLVGAFPTWPGGLDLDPDILWEIGESIPSAAFIE